MRLTFLATILLSLALSACGESSNFDGDSGVDAGADSGSGVDSGADSSVDAPGGTCAPQDIAGEGLCTAILGVRWNGSSCETVGGCDCVGADCGEIFRDEASCEAAYRECLPPDCTRQDAEGVGDCDLAFGFAWDGSACVGIGGCECVGADCGELFESFEACQAEYVLCQPADCQGQDARGVGLCTGIVGIYWDGIQCATYSGCGCEGTDCDQDFETLEACEATYGACEPQACIDDSECAPQEHCSAGTCATSPCAGDGTTIECRLLRPDCEPGEVAVPSDSCWECVSESTCE